MTTPRKVRDMADLAARALENSVPLVYNTSRLMEIFGFGKDKAHQPSE